VAVALSQLVSGVVTDPLLPGAPLTAALLLVLAASLWASPPDRRELAVVILIPLVFLALAVLVSVDRMILLPRILCWMTIPLSLALARGLFAAARLRPLLGGLTAVTLAVGLVWQLGFAEGAKEPWRDVLGAVGAKLARADLVVLGPSTDPVVLAYYAPQVQGARMWENDGPPNIENSDMRERLHVGRISLDDIVQAIAAGRSVWVVANYVDQPSLPGLLERTPPPTRRIDRHCGKYACVTVLGWAAAPNGPPRSP
jgi:4-amino-4-deoxy-L-arabinose transferase-like glycosyltransferase